MHSHFDPTVPSPPEFIPLNKFHRHHSSLSTLCTITATVLAISGTATLVATLLGALSLTLGALITAVLLVLAFIFFIAAFHTVSFADFSTRYIEDLTCKSYDIADYQRLDDIISRLTPLNLRDRQKGCMAHINILKESECTIRQDYLYLLKISDNSLSLQEQDTTTEFINILQRYKLVKKQAKQGFIVRHYQLYITNCIRLIDALMTINNDRIVIRSAIADILNQEIDQRLNRLKK